MKIAIYGDSHAAGQINKSLNSELSWVELLAEKFSDITVYARAGSSLYYSYRNFLNTHKSFDKIIFFATFGARLYINNLSVPENFRHISTIDQIDNMLPWVDGSYYSPVKKAEIKTVLKAAEQYFLYIQDDRQSEIYRQLILKDIREKRPDSIIFDVDYYNSNCEDLLFYNLESSKVFGNNNDVRHMHMSKEKNIALANILIDNLINNKTDIDYKLIKQAVPSKKFEEYFIPLKQMPGSTAKVVPIPNVKMELLP